MSQTPLNKNGQSDDWKTNDYLKPWERWFFNIMITATILLGIFGTIVLLLK